MTHLIDGKALAAKQTQHLYKKISDTVLKPTLHVVLVGDNPASQVYVSNKHKACKRAGIDSHTHFLSKTATQQEVISTLEALNNDPTVHGILLQLPLPKHLNTQEILDTISPLKDVDGLHAENAGLLLQARPRFVPCTPLGCLELIKTVLPCLKGKTVGVIGRSVLVGGPMGQLALNEGASLIQMHSLTRNIKNLSRQCDVLVVAAGCPDLVDEEFITPQTVVIDVGITKLPTGKIVGDVNFSRVFGKCQAITPVPGGVGPMTIASLLNNTYQAYQLQQKENN